MGGHKTAKLTHGGSQAVRLPKEFRFEGGEVRIERDGDSVVLRAETRPASGRGLWDEIDAVRGDEQLAYSDQPVIRDFDLDLILSLDTNVMVDLINGRRPQVRRQYDDAVARDDRLVTCAIAAYELMYGALISQRPDVQRVAAERFLKNVEIVDWTFSDGLAAAQLRRGLRRRGSPIGEHDLLISGQALNRGWAVVSANLRDFLRVDALDVFDWTA